MVYSGSLKDVNAVKITFNKFDCVIFENSVLIVMNKEFFSTKNTIALQGVHKLYRFDKDSYNLFSYDG